MVNYNLNERIDCFNHPLVQGFTVGKHTRNNMVTMECEDFTLIVATKSANCSTSYVTMVVSAGSLLCSITLYRGRGYVFQPYFGKLDEFEYPYDLREETFFQKSLVQDFGILTYEHLDMMRKWLDHNDSTGVYVQ